MDIVKKIAIVMAIGFFIFYILGSISGAQSHPRERIAPYVNYYRNR